jgi:hypothetical protein
MIEPSETSVETALAHLAMLTLAARREYSPKSGEVERREAALMAFIRSGQCLATDADRQLITAVNQAVQQVTA